MKLENNDRRPTNDGPRLRAYRAPAITESSTFETLALSCGKVNDETIDCISSPSQS